MRSFIIFVEKDNSWSPIDWVSNNGGAVDSISKNIISIQREGGWFSIRPYNDIDLEFDEADLEALYKVVNIPVVGYMIEWGGKEGASIVEELLRSAPPEVRAVAINDNDVFSNFQQILNVSFENWYLM